MIINIATLFSICLLSLAAGLILGMSVENSIWAQEMVNRGYAEWQIVTGTKEVEFKWKENQ